MEASLSSHMARHGMHPTGLSLVQQLRRLFYVSFIAYCYGYCCRLGYSTTTIQTHARAHRYAGWKNSGATKCPEPKSKRHTRKNAKLCVQKFHFWFGCVSDVRWSLSAVVASRHRLSFSLFIFFFSFVVWFLGHTCATCTHISVFAISSNLL